MEQLYSILTDLSNYLFTENNWLAITLFCVAIWGVIHHWMAFSETQKDMGAVVAAGRNGLIKKGISTEARTELILLGVKLSLGVGYLLTVLTEHTTIYDANDWQSVAAFTLQLAVLFLLSTNTYLRSQARQDMIRQAMANLAEGHHGDSSTHSNSR